jgi:hypothetical protein
MHRVVRVLVLLCFAGLSVVPVRVVASAPSNNGSAPVTWSIGRLWIDHGQHMCTAFIVGSQRHEEPRDVYYRLLIATAGHCLKSDMQMELHAIQTQASDGRRIRLPRQIAHVHPIAYSRDWDILVGSAVSWWPMPTLAIDPTPVAPGAPLLVTGYGDGVLGAKLFPAAATQGRSGFLSVDGLIRPGYSGSPVLLAGTRRVVGIAVQQRLPDMRMWFACAFGSDSCQFQPPYYAVPIHRVADLIDLSVWQ